MIKRRNFVLIILICVACLLSTTAIISFAVAYKQNREQLTTEIGTVKVVSVVNPTESTKLEYKTTGTTNVNVSINLDCNVNAVVRVKISPRFYDENDRQVVIPNSLIYNVNDHQGRWISDTNNMCFYFANSVKDIEVLDFLKQSLNKFGLTLSNSSAINFSLPEIKSYISATQNDLIFIKLSKNYIKTML